MRMAARTWIRRRGRTAQGDRAPAFPGTVAGLRRGMQQVPFPGRDKVLRQRRRHGAGDAAMLVPELPAGRLMRHCVRICILSGIRMTGTVGRGLRTGRMGRGMRVQGPLSRNRQSRTGRRNAGCTVPRSLPCPEDGASACRSIFRRLWPKPAEGGPGPPHQRPENGCPFLPLPVRICQRPAGESPCQASINCLKEERCWCGSIGRAADL